MNFKKILISGAAGALMFGSLAVGAFAAAPNWNVTGSWNFDVVSTVFPGTYLKTMTIVQDSSGNITGTGSNVPAGNTWSVSGSVSGNTINFLLNYDAPMSGYVASFVGNIQPDGTINGTWSDVMYSDSGPWHSTVGTAVLIQNVTADYNFITTDNGMQGLWATDNFHSKVTITPDVTLGCYKVVRVDGGTFMSLPGAMSPGGTGGTLIGNGTKGSISGGLTMVICGSLRNAPLPNLTPEDLRAGGYGSFYADKYFHRFFSSITGETWVDWGWTFKTCNNGTWVDNDVTEADYGVHAPSALMGDITGIYVPCSPTNKDQCKKDGWKLFTNLSFRNQGQCVSYVEKHEKDTDRDNNHNDQEKDKKD